MSNQKVLATKLRLIAATAEEMAQRVEDGAYYSDDVAQACSVIERANREAANIAKSESAGDR